MLRPPAVAGRFYPSQPDHLLRDVAACVPADRRGLRALGCLAPHAGYMYSGGVAGAVYGALDLPVSYVILCPNHQGYGAPLAVYPAGEWETPLGRAMVDSELTARIQAACPELREDTRAHASEHALEVQLPFLQHLSPGFRFVPIAIATDRFGSLEALGEAIAAVLSREKRETLIVASSDMNHYEEDALTRRKDRRAIDAMLALDPRGLYDVVRKERITMCGYGPAVAMLQAVRILGANRAELIRYATSGEKSGDFQKVVGYAGMAFYRSAGA